MEPALTVNLHWGEYENGKMRMRSFCCGTASFEIPEKFKLDKEQQHMLQQQALEEDSDSSSTWDDL